MAGHRIERVNEQLRRELSHIVVGEVRDPRVGPLSVTRVVTAPDLTLARVFVQVTGDEDERRETLEGLRAATPFIRTALGQRLPLRRVPELRFERDRNLEHAQRIEELLRESAPADGARSVEEEGAGERGDAEE